jgi:5-oxoprolinase (ATP-hydrolysing)
MEWLWLMSWMRVKYQIRRFGLTMETLKKQLKAKMAELKENPTKRLRDQGFPSEKIVFEEYLNMRYRGTESALMVVKPDPEKAKNKYGGDDWAFGKAFVAQHESEFGFTLPDRDIIVDDVRARGIGKTFEGLEKTVDQQLKEITSKDVKDGKQYGVSKVYFEGGRQDTPIYRLEDLDVGDRISGPAILADGTQTIVVTPGASALVIETHVVINIGKSEGQDTKVNAKEIDPIMLSIFAHRFIVQNRWDERCRRRVSAPTSKKGSTTLALYLTPAVG